MNVGLADLLPLQTPFCLKIWFVPKRHSHDNVSGKQDDFET